MTTAWWWLATLGSLTIQVAETPPSVSADSRDIVVVANRAPDLEKQLATCLARGCRPDEDIALTLKLADAQFEAGAYADARTAILASRRRTARFAETYPVAVANLHHANRLIAGHLGEAESEWSSALDTISAMKAGTSDTDPRVFLERIELGDAYATAGRFEDSFSQYRSIARRAHKLGLGEIEAMALLRIATLYTRVAEVRYDVYAQTARTAIDHVLALRGPNLATYAVSARILQTQLALMNAKGDAVDRIIAAYGVVPAGDPAVLLYAPSISVGQAEIKAMSALPQISALALAPTSRSNIAMDTFEDKWIDVAFNIGTDGRVREAQVTKHGKNTKAGSDWAAVVVSGIANRRYAFQASPSRARERFTFTSNFTSITETRIRQRGSMPRLVRVVLDPEPA